MQNNITSLPARPALARLALARLFLLCLLGLAGVAGLAGGPLPAMAAETAAVEAAQATQAAAPLAPGARVLVLPFTCYILDEDYLEAQDSILKTLESNLIYALQQRGFTAADESGRLPKRSAKAAQADTYLPLTPASSLSKNSTGELEASPLEEGQWEEAAPNASMAVGSPPPQLDDSDVVGEGTALLTPRDNTPRPDKGTRLGAPELDDAVIAQALEESGITQKAAQAGYDYVLTGSVSYINADVKPSVYHGDRELTSVRSTFSFNYRLLEADEAEVAASGTASGRSGKIINLRGAGFGETQLNNAVSLVLNQSIQAAAANMVEQLVQPGGANAAGGQNEKSRSDREYYDDSPGKRLKPAN